MRTDTLAYLNSLIGFCVKDSSWPSPLSDLDYEALYSEKELSVAVENFSGTVVIDLLIGSASESHAICLEIKSGQVDKKQLRRYLGIRPTDLFDQGLVPAGFERSAISHDVMYVSSEDNRRMMARTIKNQLPVLLGSRKLFRLSSGEISNHKVDLIFRDGISVEGKKPPSSYIQFTGDPSHRMKLLQSVLANLAQFLVKGDDFTLQSLVIVSVPHWNMIGSQERRTFRNTIRDQISEAASTEISLYLNDEGGGKWSCLQGKIVGATSTMKLARELRTHMGRIQSGFAYNPPRPGQLGLPGLSSSIEIEDE